jgi:hypothetical protein
MAHGWAPQRQSNPESRASNLRRISHHIVPYGDPKRVRSILGLSHFSSLAKERRTGTSCRLFQSDGCPAAHSLLADRQKVPGTPVTGGFLGVGRWKRYEANTNPTTLIPIRGRDERADWALAATDRFRKAGGGE